MTRFRLEDFPPNVRERLQRKLALNVLGDIVRMTPRALHCLAAPPSVGNMLAAFEKPPKRRGRINANRCEVEGIPFPSETQARVYLRLRCDCTGTDLRLFHEVKFPLWNLEPFPNGRPRTIQVDFVIVRGLGEIVRVVDAKPKNKAAVSRDWARGKAAFEAAYGIKIEECNR